MTKHERREAVAAILARYLVTPTTEDAKTLTLIVESLPETDPVRNAIEATMCIGYHDDVSTMDYVFNCRDMA